MTREEFIIESAIRNMQALCSRNISASEMNSYRNTYATTAVGLANAMANDLFKSEENF